MGELRSKKLRTSWRPSSHSASQACRKRCRTPVWFRKNLADKVRVVDHSSGHHVPLAYRVLLHGILAIIVVFFLFGSHITWINCITGFAWRAWPLLLAGRRTSVAVKATLLGQHCGGNSEARLNRPEAVCYHPCALTHD